MAALSCSISCTAETNRTRRRASQAFSPNEIAKWLFPLCKALHKGKSHLATALGYKAVLAGRTVRFTTAQDLVEDLYAALADGSLRVRMRALARLDLLIVDELGFLALDNTASTLLSGGRPPCLP